jgi:hypothetical protein
MRFMVQFPPIRAGENDLLVGRAAKRCGRLVLDPKLLPRTWLALGGLERGAPLPLRRMAAKASFRHAKRNVSHGTLQVFEMIEGAESAISRFLLFSSS